MAGIYLHIPFCRKACHYCDFHFSTQLKNKQLLLDAMHREMELRAARSGIRRISTIYFGGGTPSVLNASEISAFLDRMASLWEIDPDVEITLEGNPDDLIPSYLKDLESVGVNRLSIGVQSFDESLLRWMNRSHSASQALKVLRDAVEKGWSLTADLIYGIPGLSDDRLRHDADVMIDLGLPHISAYALTVEERTVLAHRVSKGLDSIDEDQQRRQYYLLHDHLQESGYEAYELSNYALPGHRSKHNSSYWKGEYYLGIGPSAHSYEEDRRSWNVANNMYYIHSLEKGVLPAEFEDLSPRDRFNEQIMTTLRLSEGIDLDAIEKAFGPEARTELESASQKFQESGWLEEKDAHLILGRSGRFFADRIASELFRL